MARIIWHSCAPWALSGYGQQTALFTQRLAAMGHEVIISSYWGLSGAATQWNGITVLPGFGQGYCSTSLIQHTKQFQPDLVVTLGDIWVLDAQNLAGLPIAHWLPCDSRPMSTADRISADISGAHLIAMSRFGQERFRTAGYENPLYVPHGIDVTNTWKPPKDRVALREQIGLDPDSYIVGLNGANNDAIRKAAPEIMLAFAKFAKDKPNVRLAMHTGIHTEGGQDLEAIAENLGIMNKLSVVDQYRYAAGMIGSADLNEWYGVLDVFIGCSYGEGFGIPLIEAMACGVPCIATDASSMTEVNRHGINVDGEPFWNGVHKAWWIRPSIKGMVAALEESYEKRGEVDREKIRKFVVDEYDVDKVAVNYMKPAVDDLLERMQKRK